MAAGKPWYGEGAGTSDLDAMGNDKRRPVIGQQYGASARKRLIVYGIAIAVIVLVIVAFMTVISGVDNKEIALEDTAPWSGPDALQEAPRDVDFQRNGPTDTIPADEILNR
ncbi:MAG: hypothetical protein U0R51_09795 [Solirubrobacterales bacterium]